MTDETNHQELPKGYVPQEVEQDIYQRWEDSGYFNPDNLPPVGGGNRKEMYSNMMPPPNVTGILHLGHALENTLMDINVRYQRMCGKKALLVPGTDHAAVATQARVEKDLIESGKYTNPRQELGREGLLDAIREYAEQSKSTILNQIRRMGTSCDWSRLAYTFDDERSQIVNDVFVNMYNDGLVYRGERIVNWDPKLQSTVSDDEIVRVEQKDPFYYLQYGPFVIATARPETKFGDKYVVMHPDDDRYKEYSHGDTFECEWINGPITATVIKDEAIDMELGTGVMTITPWHDATDFEIAERHQLDKEQIIDWNGHLLPIAGEFEGMYILKARKKIIEKLQAKGLVVKIDEDYEHAVATGDRSGGLLEPQIKAQWFVNVSKEIPGRGKSLKDLMKDAVTMGHNGNPDEKVTIQPDQFHKVYMHWIENLHDWCISRQIWWGHRIIAWYKGGEVRVSPESPGEGWEQDPDTLDTWFSSGMWTFSTLGGPGTSDMETFHPTTWMQMGYEILFLWMARMILMSTYVLDEIPFRDVYIHGMLRAKDGRKFSKSLRNSIDPIEMIDTYGTDALRMALITGTSPGQDSKFYEEKVEHHRNFINKIWNLSRFLIMRLEGTVAYTDAPEITSAADRWIMSRLHSVIRNMSGHIEQYRFSQAAEVIYEFAWHEFADWYVEVAKQETHKEQILAYVLVQILKLLHPYAPFVSEYIWSLLQEHVTGNKELNELLMVASWPILDESQVNETAEQEFNTFRETVTAIRNYKSGNGIKIKDKIEIYESVADALTNELKDLVAAMVHVKFTSNGAQI